MPKGSPKLTAARREEIINACERLYETVGFKDITLKDIGEETRFTRTSVYNYFNTKEEIFLALFKREYDRWNDDLEALLRAEGKLSDEELADRIARTVESRGRLLRLLSMNIYDMETHSSPEALVSFKRSYGKSLENMDLILRKFRPEMSVERRGVFVRLFFPFMFGIYPYTSLTGKQKAAMEEAGINPNLKTVYELTKEYLIKLLSAK
ncbi:MAG: TetR family transcriptional regulator [Abditibacteriota bacterium]|nr:TetR family transcriptional regulator [Abditibacteriota bacterium]